jgi:hypothetical protein
MKWIHWTEKEPEDNQEIFVCFEPYENELPHIGHMKYLKIPGTWEDFKSGKYERIGWDYWMPYSDMPLPEEFQKKL